MSRAWYILLGAGLFVFTACQPKLYRKLKKEQSDFSFSYTSGPCLGTCAVFSWRLNGDGKAQFKGQHFTAYEGDTSFLLSRQELAHLKDLLIDNDFAALDSAYVNPQIADLPKREMKLQLPALDYSHRVQAQWEVPDSYLSLEAYIRELLRRRSLLMGE